MTTLSPSAKQLILDSEGLDQPAAWPGGRSGVTIGIGYDLGYNTVDHFEADWKPHLSCAILARLRTAIGLRGEDARRKAAEFGDIKIQRAAAQIVFEQRTLPRFLLYTQQTFPHIEKLPPDAQGALVSLVYNRGGSMIGDERKEMRAIQKAVATGDLAEIARQLRLMKRLWVGKGLDGLLKRREAEAVLIESCLPKPGSNRLSSATSPIKTASASTDESAKTEAGHQT